MKGKTYIWFCLAAAGIMTGCKTVQKEEAQVLTVVVETITVSTAKHLEPLWCTGILASKTESRLSFKTGGIINRILADEGQSVKEGQLLAELNLEEVRSHVRQAELLLSKARRDYHRAENLYRDSVATLEQFENAKTALEVARSNSRIARFNLKYSAIHAPAEGKILKRIAEPNEIIAPGHPVFLFASTRNDWIVRTNLTDKDVIRVSMLDTAQVFFDAYRDEIFMGVVSEIGTASDPYTGTYEVEIQMLRKPDKLVSGFVARVRLYPGEGKEVICIPYEALTGGTGLSGYVFVAEKGKARRRKVEIASFSDMGIIIRSGISSGEQLIIEGNTYLRDGAQIEVRP